ncbi:IS30 family transposase [Agaribacterium haliotis]|uniref:IS30 family transposase n=1 Tax=Agaribacterium haliotis TaxID=2013869 RepID=UPI000BB56276|nr:IS30 family transposase [Agaribacterium haliotis]
MNRIFTQDERELVFDLWKQGSGFSDIARVLDSKPGSIFSILRDHGGIKPVTRKRNSLHLSLEEREEIRAGLSAKLSIREIAKRLGRAPSTISREVNRNRGRRWYKAVYADSRAWREARRPKSGALAVNSKLRKIVIDKLTDKWSPEQISGWLKVNKPDEPNMQVSYETIYKSLYVRSRKALDHALSKHLRRSHKMRQSKRYSTSGDRGTIKVVNGISIHERPRSIDARKEIGHWEGDLVSGSNNSHIATLVDRRARYTIILKVAGKDAGSVNKALIKAFRKLPGTMKRSLTWDRGMELAKHAEFTKETKVPVYFCDPKSPWQRGTNENTNSLIRQYFPKKTSLAKHSQNDLNKVARALNQRPRKTLGFKTPKEVLEEGVALTG